MSDRTSVLQIEKMITDCCCRAAAGGTAFVVAAPENARVQLLLYRKGEALPEMELEIPESCRTGRLRDFLVRGLDPEKYEYNFRIDGEIRQDPRACIVMGRDKFGEEHPEEEHAVRCGFSSAKPRGQKDIPAPDTGFEDMILYKLHVRGFTMAGPARVKHKGTFRGIAESIPYFKSLGINALELMPSYEFAEREAKKKRTGMVQERRQTGLVNFWGYKEGLYFAPKRSYCAGEDPEKEFREMVRSLHRAGILCIMEFYFPAGVKPLTALYALRHWREYYKVDGFHAHGDGFPASLVLQDNMLSDAKLLVDPYDLSSVYGGKTPEKRNVAFCQNGFWQDMRRLLKSDEGMVDRALQHIRDNASDHGVINYMTCQDGFTMQDLVSYSERHNEANGQGNQDGSSFNYSWNCGEEGPTRKTAVKKLREQQVRNAFLLMLLSQGTPMIYAGDEFGNSQGGNNNAWCQDNEIGWVDWKGLRRNKELLNFVKRAITFRGEHPVLHLREPLKGTDYLALGSPDISFHGERAWYVNHDHSGRMFGVLYNEAYGKKEGESVPASGAGDKKRGGFLYIAYNFQWEDRNFALPNLPGGMVWAKVCDTSDRNACSFEPGELCREKSVRVGMRSIVILAGREA